MSTKFELSPMQEGRWIKWRDKHVAEAHPKGVRDMSGYAFNFIFGPTGDGCNVRVECVWCPGKKINLTEGDDGEFIYDDEHCEYR